MPVFRGLHRVLLNAGHRDAPLRAARRRRGRAAPRHCLSRRPAVRVRLELLLLCRALHRKPHQPTAPARADLSRAPPPGYYRRLRGEHEPLCNGGRLLLEALHLADAPCADKDRPLGLAAHTKHNGGQRMFLLLLRPQDRCHVQPVPGALKHANMNVRHIFYGAERRGACWVMLALPLKYTPLFLPCCRSVSIAMLVR